MEYVIEVDNLSKSFRSYETHQGEKIFLASLRRKYYTQKALQNVSFKVKKGDIVMLLGQNGSGKSTLIKILVGILHPDKGDAKVLGITPWEERVKLAWDYGMVSGAHNQLFWNLPAIDSFNYVRGIYGIPKKEFDERLAYFVKMLALEDVYKKQVRTLSLGERMKCNFVASVLHLPKIVFMDEATIGMDLPAVLNLREAIFDMRDKHGMTFFITTHIVDEIKALARGVIIIDKGRIVFDGTRAELQRFFGSKKQLEIRFNKEIMEKDYARFGEIVEAKKDYLRLEIEADALKSSKISELLNDEEVMDYNVSDPDLAKVLARFYKLNREKRRRR
ncbi:MAG TPA: ATP-binding cassette domain-containing protein [Candidatus Aquilonibacter sp.]|nr:ATP-binding cassette domain-containing protein [Candidatus Aquilonibacter sp.]